MGAKEEKEGGQGEADAPTPKRPPSSYMMYASEVRPQVMKEHPGKRMGEVSKIIGELWGKLGAEEKKRYTDASKRALEKFKAEHPNLPKKKRKRKNEAQAKVKEEKEKEKEQEEQEEEETEDKEFKDEDVDKDKKEYAKASKRAQEEPPNPPKSKRKKKKKKPRQKKKRRGGKRRENMRPRRTPWLETITIRKRTIQMRRSTETRR